MSRVKPLGVFAGARFDERDEAFIKYLRSTAETIPEGDTRTRLAAYLRAAPVVQAWMSRSRDLIDGSFEVSGGAALQTDGVYFWRRDTANYMETHGVELPPQFVRRALSMARPPVLSEPRLRTIDRLLTDSLNREALEGARQIVVDYTLSGR